MSGLMSKMSENKKIKILVYILLFIVLFGVSGTSIYYSNLTPFALGIVFALYYIKFSGYYLSIIYILAYVLSGLTFNSFLCAINVVVVLCLLEYFASKNNYIVKKWQLFVLMLVSQMVYICVSIGDTKENLALFVSIVLGLLFLYSCLCFLDATINRGMMIKLNLDEKVCGAVILIIFILGMASTNISTINLGFVFVSFIILCSTYLLSGGMTVIISAIMGIGFSIVQLSTINISLFIILALISLSFKCNFKYLSMVGVVLSYLLFGLFFGVGISLGEVISLGIGGVIFAIIPLKSLYMVADVFDTKNHVMVKDLISRSKHQVIDRVNKLSVIFSDMTTVYKGMVKGLLPDDKAMQMLKDELIEVVCKDCPNKDICFRKNGTFLENSIDTIINIGYEKGKVLLIDLPQYLTSNCLRINKFVLVLNNLLSSYKEYSSAINNLDTSRILIADQLNGVSKLLESLSKEVDINISFDGRIESKIREELSYKNIVCLECVIYERDIQTKNITLIVKTDTIDNALIEKVVSKIVANKMRIVSVEDSEIKNASIVRLITKPNYEIAYGISVINKSGKKISGDSHTVVKLEDGKYMVSICDGMGSGENAHNISKLSISLIENFYKAGFDNDIILSSVNKLLSLSEQENFSTIDLCVIDGRKNIYDFIKLGASKGYIKRDRGDVEIIDSSGLPVGVLEEVRPHITKKLINPMDMLIFVSDGVSDSFENKQDLKNFISISDSINPQTLSKEILNKALELNGDIAIDDMTVMCVRVFESV